MFKRKCQDPNYVLGSDSVSDEPAQASLFVRQDHFQDIVFHPQLSDENSVIYYRAQEERNVNLGTASNLRM